MTTSDLLFMLLALAGGLLAGAVFFGGLWITVQRLATARRPALLMLGSLLVRTAVVLGLFFLLGRGHLDRMLACLGGFVAARLIVMRVTRAKSPEKDQSCT